MGYTIRRLHIFTRNDAIRKEEIQLIVAKGVKARSTNKGPKRAKMIILGSNKGSF